MARFEDIDREEIEAALAVEGLTVEEADREAWHWAGFQEMYSEEEMDRLLDAA